MRYRYKVVKSKSPKFPKGMAFVTDQKMHDGRKQVTELADADCNSFWLEVVLY